MFHRCRDLSLVNAHLIHDASNIDAYERVWECLCPAAITFYSGPHSTPSSGVTCCSTALPGIKIQLCHHIIIKSSTLHVHPDDHFFVFGDFNFRLDLPAVVQVLLLPMRITLTLCSTCCPA